MEKNSFRKLFFRMYEYRAALKKLFFRTYGYRTALKKLFFRMYSGMTFMSHFPPCVMNCFGEFFFGCM